ncbi:MAG: IPTL-CTERM sorting domain-containing protein [Holophagales bacterium]|nr:IPTL-CTERM sorting domain-containing protein [Holophagales bacterium]MBK9964655.1 IPTL-CTERM sorting domain-containing protein [Holophagales bacterium]
MPFKRSVAVSVVSLAVVLAALLAPGVALASATVTSTALTCDSFTASGTSTSPYATVYAYNPDTDLDYFVVVPVVGGNFTGTVTFPVASPGTVFNLEAWGSLAMWTSWDDPNYWDGEAYFDENRSSCAVTAIPALDRTGLALLAGLLAVAGAFAARRGVA